MKIEFFVAIATLLTTIISASFAYFLNERAKRREERYNKREEKYRNLITLVEGFYVGNESSKLKNEFLREYRQSWLYCPDDIILKLNSFLDKIGTGENGKEEELAELVILLRQDLIQNKKLKTNLTFKDYRHFLPTKKSNQENIQ